MFEDVHSRIDHKLERNRIPGSDFDEATYADDKACFHRLQNHKPIHKRNGRTNFRYGLKLNKKTNVNS